jgi:hypothetical protein
VKENNKNKKGRKERGTKEAKGYSNIAICMQN